MLSHAQIWAAIDALANHKGLTPSSLAKRAGLDPTTFNRSKRVKPDGNPRWPSTESIAKILNATGVSIDAFIGMIPRDDAPEMHKIPFRLLADNLAHAFDAGGKPLLDSWARIVFPHHNEKNAFALEIQDSRFFPVYRAGDVVVVAPETPVRRGDRVFVLMADGSAGIEVLGHQAPPVAYLNTLKGEEQPPRRLDQVRLIARIVWASQ
ncbi:MAG: helix-turn-helix transcriptional regulator [Proteobacteria bacterium]|nr:helix-turn-helix transcriptional regulator [Pseudomonadota bacterium]